MDEYNDPNKIGKKINYAKLMALVVIFIGCAVLLGWMFNLEYLKSVLPGFVSMKANTAIAFIFVGLALLLFEFKHKFYAGVFATVVALIGLSTLSEYVFGWKLGIDELLFKDIGAALTFYPGRMAIVTAFNFSLLGIGALFLIKGFKKNADTLFLLALLNSLMAFLGYLEDVQEFYKVGGVQVTAMALHTSIAFMFIIFGFLVSRVGVGFLKIVTSNALGGKFFRRTLWKEIVLIIVFAKIINLGRTLGFYTYGFEMVIFLTLIIITISLTLFFGARALEREELQKIEIQLKNEAYRKEYEANLEKEKNELRKVNSYLVGRELKMIELKQEIEELRKNIKE